jgi:hypothetical protein
MNALPASVEAPGFTFAPVASKRRKPSAAAIKIAELHNSHLPPKPKPDAASEPSPPPAPSESASEGAETLESLLGEPSAPEPAKIAAPLRHDSATAIDFLRWLDPDGRHNLCVIHPTKTNHKGEPLCEGRTFAPHSWASVAAYVDQHQDWNCYFSVNEPKPNAADEKLAKDDIGAIRAVPADFDPKKKLEEAGNLTEERARIAALSGERLADEDAPASVAIDSGGGHQLLWILQQKVSATEFGERGEAQARGISRRFDGDSAVTPVCQVMRLPGTINLPNEGKRARGRVPTRATLLASNDNRHTLEALSKWTAPVAAPAGSGKAKDEDTLPIEWALVYDCADYGDLPKAFRRKFEDACGRNPTLKTLWETGEGGPRNDDSRSGGVFALSGLLRGHAFLPLEYAQLVHVWEFQSETHADSFERYVARAWNRNSTPIGGEGFEAVDIDESKAPSNPRHQIPPPDPKLTGGYKEAESYICSDAPDSVEEPDQEKAALVVATYLQRCALTEEQRNEFMQDWAIAYGEQIAVGVLARAMDLAARGATVVKAPAARESPNASPANDNGAAVSIGDDALFPPKDPVDDELIPALEPFDPAELPEIPWVIENFIARRTSVLLIAPGGSCEHSTA